MLLQGELIFKKSLAYDEAGFIKGCSAFLDIISINHIGAIDGLSA